MYLTYQREPYAPLYTEILLYLRVSYITLTRTFNTMFLSSNLHANPLSIYLPETLLFVLRNLRII